MKDAKTYLMGGLIGNCVVEGRSQSLICAVRSTSLCKHTHTHTIPCNTLSRRKFNILEKYGYDEEEDKEGESGGAGAWSSTHARSGNLHCGEELDMLIENLNGATSRPSTTSR